MKKSVPMRAVFTAAVVSLPLLATTITVHAQSTTTLYGIVDAAVRRTTNEQLSPAFPSASNTRLIGGGMSQSRLGVNVAEDLGGGNRAIAGFEHRFLLDSGTQAGTEFWQQSWVGLQTGFGRVTLGRQYNVLFDVYTSAYPSFKYSPYIEAYKPELGFSLGSRVNNSLKYAAQYGSLSGEVVLSAGEASPIGGKSAGGMLRYVFGDFIFGGAYMQLEDGAGVTAKGSTLGGSWASGPWYLSASFARNSFEAGFNPLLVIALLTANTTNGFYGPNIDHRDGYSLGATYQLTTQLNLGGHYWHVKQQGVTLAGNGKANFMALVADYAFSKRTDAYVEVDHTKFDGSVTFPNGARTRLGTMVGLRHRF